MDRWINGLLDWWSAAPLSGSGATSGPAVTSFWRGKAVEWGSAGVVDSWIIGLVDWWRAGDVDSWIIGLVEWGSAGEADSWIDGLAGGTGLVSVFMDEFGFLDLSLHGAVGQRLSNHFIFRGSFF